MPSRQSRVILGVLRSGKGFFSKVGTTIMNVGKLPDPVVAQLPTPGLQCENIDGLGVPAILLHPDDKAVQGKLLLHCHGGAYVSGGLMQAKAIASLICSAAKISTLTFAYRLAPEFPYPAAVDDAMRVWDALMDGGIRPEDIALAGESAGGNLCLAICQRLKAEHRPLPSCMVLLSPWCDLQQTGVSYTALQKEDATLNGPDLYQSALDYAGGNEALLADPMLSPLHADFAGYPPAQIHVGTSEILMSDSETLCENMRQAGVNATLLRWTGMCHVFQAFGFPESKASLDAAGAFLQRYLVDNGEEKQSEDTHESV